MEKSLARCLTLDISFLFYFLFWGLHRVSVRWVVQGGRCFSRPSHVTPTQSHPAVAQTWFMCFFNPPTPLDDSHFATNTCVAQRRVKKNEFTKNDHRKKSTIKIIKLEYSNIKKNFLKYKVITHTPLFLYLKYIVLCI